MNPAPDTLPPRRRFRKLRLAFVAGGLVMAALVVLFLPPGRGDRDAVQIQFSRFDRSTPGHVRVIFSVTNAGPSTVHYWTAIGANSAHPLNWNYRVGKIAFNQLASHASATVEFGVFEKPFDPLKVFDPDVGRVSWYAEPSRLQKFKFQLMNKTGAAIPALRTVFDHWNTLPTHTNFSAAIRF